MSPGQDEGWTSGNLADRMTPADHANTVRDGLQTYVDDVCPSAEFMKARGSAWFAALDALQAEAEQNDWAKDEAGDFYSALKAAEAERDQLIQQVTSGRAGEEELRGEWLTLKAERDRLADALRDIAEEPAWRDVSDLRAIARAALARTEQP